MDYRSPPPLSIMIADSGEETRAAIKRRLQGLAGWTLSLETADTGEACLRRLREAPCDLVLLGSRLADADGLSVLVQLRQLFEKSAVVMLACDGSEAVAVAAMKQGALDYLTVREFESLDLGRLLRRVMEVRELSNMNMELRQINSMKNEFIANVSHEMRTPLSVVLGYAKSLQDLSMGPINEKQAKALEAIIERADGLLTTLNQILRFRQAGEGQEKLLLKPLDLNEWLARAVASPPKGLAKRRMRLEPALPGHPVWVLADAAKLGEALDNLLSNAVKFGPEGSVVGVALTAADGMARLSVHDQGPGVPPELLPHLFERMFSSGQAPTREHGGLGLGLPLARHVAELHSGRVWLESPGAGAGCAAHIALPLSAPDAAEVVVGKQTPVEKKRILIVEDNSDLIEVLMLFMSSISPNLKVYAANSGFEALESIKEQAPHLIILDVMMPGMSGLDVIERLRRVPETEKIPVLVLTGYHEGAQLALKIGAKDVLMKPFEKTTFIKKVTRLLQPAQ